MKLYGTKSDHDHDCYEKRALLMFKFRAPNGKNQHQLLVRGVVIAHIVATFCLSSYQGFANAYPLGSRPTKRQEEQQSREQKDGMQSRLRKRDLEIFQQEEEDGDASFDVLNCPNNFFYHNQDDEATTNSIQESVAFFDKWHKETFHEHLRYGTLNDLLLQHNPRSMLQTIESGGKFIYWLQHAVKKDVLPVIEMSLFNGTIFEEKGKTTLRNDATIIVDSKKHIPYTWKLVSPNRHNDFQTASRNVIQLPEGPKEYIVFASGWHTEYQHILIDHMGYWTYLKDTFPMAHFVFMMDENNDMPAKLMSKIDPDLLQRVIFLRTKERYVPYGGNQMLQAPPNTPLSVVMPLVPTRHLNLIEHARRWIWESPYLNSVLSQSSGLTGKTDENHNQKTIIYYNRKDGGSARLGRFLNSRHAATVLESIKHAMIRYNRPERLVIFDGENVTFEEQVELFRSASIVIGPHGGAIANLLFAPPHQSCNEERIKLIEFVTSSATPRVQEGDYSTTYYYFYSTIPWIELHQVFYIKPSLKSLTYLDMDGFHEALETVMSYSSSLEPTSIASAATQKHY